MHCAELDLIYEEIKRYSKYKTDAAIASRMGFHRTTIKKSLTIGKNPPNLPKGQHIAFAELLSEVLQQEISVERMCEIAKGSADEFRYLIAPLSGAEWAAAVVEHPDMRPLNVVPKSSLELGFGVTTAAAVKADETISLREFYRFEANVSYRGQGVVIGQTNGVWQLLSLSDDRRIFQFDAQSIVFPTMFDEYNPFVAEGGPIGRYKYYMITQPGAFTAELSMALQCNNPVTSDRLNVIAKLLKSSGKAYDVHRAIIDVVS